MSKIKKITLVQGLATALSRRIPIRGAIDVGLGSECWPNEIYGCVLTQVHDLEQNLAQFPRVVVGDGLFGFLDHAEQTTTGNDLADKFRRAQVTSCRNLIARDLDGAHFVDFMGLEVRKILASVKHLSDQFQAAYDFVSHEHDGFIQAKNYKLAERYGRLRCYIASRL